MPPSRLIADSLVRLNALLSAAFGRAREAFEKAQQLYKIPYGEPGFRGLAVEPDQALRILIQGGFELKREVGVWVAETASDPLYLHLRTEPDLAGLNEIDFGILMLAVAPESDTNYERLFGFLQDDVTRRRASVELAVNLFAATEAARPEVVARFSSTAPLLTARLIDLVEPGDGRTGALGAVVKCDPQFARWAIDLPGIDPRVADCTRLARPAATNVPRATIPGTVGPGLAALFPALSRPERPQRPVRLHLHGPDRRLNAVVVDLLATRVKRDLLVVDAAKLVPGPSSTETARLIAREARWFDRAVFVEGVDAFHSPERHRAWAEFTAALTATPTVGYVIVVGGWPTLPPAPHPIGFVSVELPVPDAEARTVIWKEAIAAVGGVVPGGDQVELAHRYVLTWSQIESAAQAAAARARLRPAPPGHKGPHPGATFEDFASAARVQGSYELESLTHKIVPRAELNDLVVTADVREQLDEIVSRVRNRTWVLTEWGFSLRHAHGHGVNALFAGPSGTGKTMAAEAIAHAIRKDLYKIDLTSVVSKYIGETEQKLEQIFQAGEATQAVLFFDEADSLLGKRSEVKDAHDRYANLEVSYLLQRMERYDGLIVLATNLLGNLDEAFLRRMSAIVHFSPPGPAERLRLWKQVWPDKVPVIGRDVPGIGRVWPPELDEEERPRYAVDPSVLANRFELTGGNIRNAALAAAFAAADRCFRYVSMWDVLHGVKREYQKLGQSATDEELGLNDYAAPPPDPEDDAAAPAGSGTPALVGA